MPSYLWIWPLKTLKPILPGFDPIARQAIDGPIKLITKLHLQSYNSITLFQNLKDQILTTNVWIEHVSFEIILLEQNDVMADKNKKPSRPKNFPSFFPLLILFQHFKLKNQRNWLTNMKRFELKVRANI